VRKERTHAQSIRIDGFPAFYVNGREAWFDDAQQKNDAQSIVAAQIQQAK
jgi:hypothetical protein